MNGIWSTSVLLAFAVMFGILLLWLYNRRLKTQKIRHELQNILDTLDPVALIDTNYNIVRVNEIFATSLDRTYSSLIGRKCYRVFENRMLPCPGCQLYKTVLEKQAHILPGYQWQRDGHAIYYDIGFHPQTDSDGKVRHVVEVKKDVTNLHLIKTRLEDQKLQLEYKTRELSAKNTALTNARNELQQSLEEKDRELEMARDIQMSLLPEKIPHRSGLNIWVAYNPIATVGGDIYDFIPLGDHKLGIFIGDVSGHGLSAAFVSALARMSLYNHIHRLDSPEQLFRAMNQDLRQQLRTGHFLTAFFAILDQKTNELTFVRASHPPPMVIRQGQFVRRLESRGMLLGILPDPHFVQERILLERGDRIFFFTDGCFEVAGRTPTDRLTYSTFAGWIEDYAGLPLDAIYGTLNLRVRQFASQEGMVEDDKTFIGLEITRPARIKRYRYLLHFEETDRIRRRRLRTRHHVNQLIDSVVAALEENNFGERVILSICNSIQEVAVNALVHGLAERNGEAVSVAWSVNSSQFRLSVADHGPGFRMEDVWLDRSRRGHGLLLVRTYMDEVHVDNGGRTVTISKSK